MQEVFAERYELEAKSVAGFAERLPALDRSALTPTLQTDAEILSRQLPDRINELRFRGFEMPIGSREGFHFGLPALPDRFQFTTVARARKVRGDAASVPNVFGNVAEHHSLGAVNRCVTDLSLALIGDVWLRTSGRTSGSWWRAAWPPVVLRFGARHARTEGRSCRCSDGPSSKCSRRFGRPVIRRVTAIVDGAIYLRRGCICSGSIDL